jgi:hypothetical protein
LYGCDDANPIISHMNGYKPKERLLTTQRKEGKIVWCMFIWDCKQDHLGETAMHTTSIVQGPSLTLASGVTIPDSKMAREVTELVRDTENSLLFNHSIRVYYFSAATGKRKGLTFDPELLYVSAMFRDMGLTPKHRSVTDRFEVDRANTAREFLHQQKIPPKDIETVWTSMALHTTPGIPQYMHPVVALLTNGVEMDVLGIAYSEFSDADREAIVAAHPRTDTLKKTSSRPFTTASSTSLRDDIRQCEGRCTGGQGSKV